MGTKIQNGMAEESQSLESFGWDRGIDFNEKRRQLEDLIRTTRNRRDKAFYAVALIQLRNGCRRYEAIDAAIKYAESGKMYVWVRVQKRKTKVLRPVRIPAVVRQYDSIREGFKDLAKEQLPSKAYYYFVQTRLKHNTHCLRYSFINHASNTKHAQEIAKMTGQASLDTVMHYIDIKTGFNALKDMFKDEESS